jgi:hypothetical protein
VNNPDPIASEITDTPVSPQSGQPLIPPQPWYTSPIQIAGVVAGLSQVVSILIRWFGLHITDAQLQAYSADALQIVTILAGAYAIVRRQRSQLAPLTLTRRGANKLANANPSLLTSDPSKK